MRDGVNTSVEKCEAQAVEVSCSDDALSVVLADGRTVSVPLAWFPRLVEATARQRANWELIGGGIGIHWEAIDEDISVASLLQPEHFMRLPDAQRRRMRKSRPVEAGGRGRRGSRTREKAPSTTRSKRSVVVR